MEYKKPRKREKLTIDIELRETSCVVCNMMSNSFVIHTLPRVEVITAHFFVSERSETNSNKDLLF